MYILIQVPMDEYSAVANSFWEPPKSFAQSRSLLIMKT